MSRHRIVHTFDADEIVSEFDGNEYAEEEDELSPEDRAAMTNGTAEVRRALGIEANKVTIDQIEEALWHYYYDVDKSVTYLMKTFISPAPKPTPKKSVQGMSRTINFPLKPCPFANRIGADLESVQDGAVFGDTPAPAILVSPFPATRQPTTSYSRFFDDMPWLNIPNHRRAVFIEPERPRGGLLGGGEGAPKMSKLQALAAARKKKNEEKKVQEKTTQAEKGLKKLSLNDESRKENRSVGPGQAKRQKISETTALEPQYGRPDDNSEGLEASPATNIKTSSDVNSSTPTKPWYMEEDIVVSVSTAQPSAFAQTLFGSAPKRKNTDRDTFPMPYTLSPSFVAEAFNEPSPDDIVLAAQAKGSNFARTK